MRSESRSAPPSFVRITFDQQLLSQAPPEAVAYRLVLPQAGHCAFPHIAPAPDASGALRAWRLRPFQLPDDIRLQDGGLYRILWVDAKGEPVSPQGTTHLPALRFFLGPPDPISTAQEGETASVPRNRTDSALRRRSEAELGRARLDSPRTRQEAEVPKKAIALAVAQLRNRQEADALLQQQAPNRQEDQAGESAQLREEQIQQDTPVSARWASEPPASFAEALSPGSAAAEPDLFPTVENPAKSPAASRACSVDSAPLPSMQPLTETAPLAVLSAEELKRLCGILYDVEETAQFRYEILCRSAAQGGIPPPPEPRTLLSGEKRKELRRLATDTRRLRAYTSLELRFTEAQQRGEVLRLPAPFESLGSKARDRAIELLPTEEHWSYAAILIERADALIHGLPLPPEPESRLPDGVRQKLKKLLQDRRMIAYLIYLAKRAPQAKEAATAAPQRSEP